ncbi:hypothetical protein V493_06531 [Pseudogymnoascus sp. VKM F-4281 (FW-2241)]|nr:hypothetical protein V493_06531 [Pseudogymnoascus sp. VKM F-4281 (FW-2241)]
MRSINTQRKADGKEPQEPWQYFDLMGGTSTGGIIAIMLGRLRMTISECIEAYMELSKAIFTPKRSWSSPIRGVEYLNGDGKFDSLFLEKEIKNQIRKSKLGEGDDQILLQDPGSPCKVCVFALRESNSKLAIFRSYDYLYAGQTLFWACKVWEACRATSAAPTFFDPVQLGPFKQSFIDGGLGYSNPIFKVYDEAQNIWPDRTIVATSVGTGEVPGTAFGGNLKRIAESITKIVTGCDVVADNFYNANKDMVAEKRYFRLNVTHGLGNIGLEEHKHIPEIVAHTERYLIRAETQTKVRKCVDALMRERIDNGNSIPLLRGLQTHESTDSVNDLQRRFLALKPEASIVQQLRGTGANIRRKELREAARQKDESILAEEASLYDITASDEWLNAVKSIRDECFKRSNSNRDRIKIAILDTGICQPHPFFDEIRQDRIAACKSFLDETKQDTYDTHGHGTHIAGIIMQLAPNADLYIGRVVEGDEMSLSDADRISKGIIWAISQNVDIISLSLGFNSPQDQITEAIKEANNRDILIFASASNHGANKINPISFPARDQNRVFCIHATDAFGVNLTSSPPLQPDRANFTVIGDGIKSAWTLPAGMKRKSGTSFSTPIAAAIAALVLEYVNQSSEGCSSAEGRAPAIQDRNRKKLHRHEGMAAVFTKMGTPRAGGFRYLRPWVLWGERAPRFSRERVLRNLEELVENI